MKRKFDENEKKSSWHMKKRDDCNKKQKKQDEFFQMPHQIKMQFLNILHTHLTYNENKLQNLNMKLKNLTGIETGHLEQAFKILHNRVS